MYAFCCKRLLDLHQNRQICVDSVRATRGRQASGPTGARPGLPTWANGVRVGGIAANDCGAYLRSGGRLYDIGAMISPAWQVYDAVAINDLGQIAATGCLRGSCSAVLLSSIPEPAPAAMLLAELVELGLLRRSRDQRARRVDLAAGNGGKSTSGIITNPRLRETWPAPTSGLPGPSCRTVRDLQVDVTVRGRASQIRVQADQIGAVAHTHEAGGAIAATRLGHIQRQVGHM